jgi:hypothetical protein
MRSWNCPKCNFNNAEGWTECNSCWTPKPLYKVTQEDRIKTLNRLKSQLETMRSISPNNFPEVSWFEDMVRKQEDVIKKNQRDDNLSLLLDGKDSL